MDCPTLQSRFPGGSEVCIRNSMILYQCQVKWHLGEAHAYQIRLVIHNIVSGNGCWRGRIGAAGYHHQTDCRVAVIQHDIELLGKLAGDVIGTDNVGSCQPGDWGVSQGIGYPDLSANSVRGYVLGIGCIRCPGVIPCKTELLPEVEAFRILCEGVVPVAVDYPVSVSVFYGYAGYSRQVSGRSCIISRESIELALVAVDVHRDVTEVGGQVLGPGAVDQFLAFQHAAEQQRDDHQHNGDFDQGKTGLITFHDFYMLHELVIYC